MGKRTWCGVVALSLMAVVGPDAVEAQSADVADRAAIERADLLAEHGTQLAELGSEFADAVSYMREAADLRGPDPEAVQDLLDAGHYAYYAGRGLIAVSALRAAGEVAMETGDRTTAAKAFMDAAWVAHQEGEDETALELFDLGSQVTVAQQIDPFDR